MHWSDLAHTPAGGGAEVKAPSL